MGSEWHLRPPHPPKKKTVFSTETMSLQKPWGCLLWILASSQFLHKYGSQSSTVSWRFSRFFSWRFFFLWPFWWLICRVLFTGPGGVQGEGVFLGNPKDSFFFFGDPFCQWDFQGPPQGYGTRDPYYSHVRIPKDMGIVWEAYHKGIPLLGVSGITFDFDD